MAASKDMVFESSFEDIGPFTPEGEVAKEEPMFFNASVEFARLHGGPITKAFLGALPSGWDDAVFDSRVHMLMPGWFPAIPGWHHDDVPRSPVKVGEHFINGGQPDYDTPRAPSEHILGLWNGHICPTYFIKGRCPMSAVPEGLIYRQWHIEVEKLIAENQVEKVAAPSGRLIFFNANAFHAAQPAVGNGWRWFGRVSRNTDRCKTITNELRTQVQIYMPFPMEGW